MADEIYEDAVAVEEGFENWWRAHTEFLASSKMTGQAAWRAGWEAHAAHVEPGSDEPEKRDWRKISAEVKEAGDLAKRHGLVIMSVAGTNDKRVQAFKSSGELLVEASGWPDMIETLKAMEERGAL